MVVVVVVVVVVAVAVAIVQFIVERREDYSFIFSSHRQSKRRRKVKGKREREIVFSSSLFWMISLYCYLSCLINVIYPEMKNSGGCCCYYCYCYCYYCTIHYSEREDSFFFFLKYSPSVRIPSLSLKRNGTDCGTLKLKYSLIVLFFWVWLGFESRLFHKKKLICLLLPIFLKNKKGEILVGFSSFFG